LDPGSPAPQAGILDHSSLLSTKIPDNRLLDYDPKTSSKQTELIINTLLFLKNNAKFKNTLNSVNKVLTRMSKFTDLSNPDCVKTYIANAKTKDGKRDLSNSTKSKYVYCYDCLIKAHGLTWNAPNYKWEQKAPIIPTKENVTKIISASTRRYATIFTILAETGLEGEELHGIRRKDIDTERGIIAVEGHKGHASGTYKLKPHTTEMLREYLAKNPQDHPFPRPKIMGQIWLRTRNRLADDLKQLELKNIPMKSLRNYSGAQLYYLFPDPIAVMRHLRHKKLETTMHYLRAIALTNGEEDYVCKTAKTIQEDTQLIENGFQYVTERDGLKLFRKRK
jgi:integrase